MLLKAKQQGFIESVGSYIVAMEKNGIWFSDSLINAVLKLANESRNSD